MLKRILLLVGLFIVLGMWEMPATPAHACGGLFCQNTPRRPKC